MRKRYRVLILAVGVAAIAVPLGFALSLESTPKPTAAVPPSARVVSDVGDIKGDIKIVASSSARPHLALVHTSAPARSSLPGLPDGAKLFFVGSALFGLAGVMRRTN